MPHPIRSEYKVPSGAEFGAPRAGGRHHQGTDYHCPIGTPIYATGNGRVVSSVGETGVGIGFGNYVSIAYPGGRVTLDGHLRELSSLRVGTLVTADTIVAYVGITGNAIYSSPPGSHDHHQVWLSGVLTDPIAYYGTTTASNGSTPIIPTTLPKEDDMPKNYRNADGTVFTLGETYGLIWTDPNSFSYQTNMALSPQIAINITADQITTAVGEANARGAALKSGATVTAVIDYAALAKAVNDDAAKRLAN